MPRRTSIGGVKMSHKKRKIFPVSAVGVGQAGKNYYPGTNIRITDPFFIMECPLCGWTCWSTREEPIPCQRCGGVMGRKGKEKTGT